MNEGTGLISRTSLARIMKVDQPAALTNRTEKEDIFLEVVNTEKQFLTSIHSKGLLHKESQELYCKVRAGYERIILSNHDAVDLQEVEYVLWKLHYKYIDEFRKRIRQHSINLENVKEETLKDDANAESNINRHIDGFKSFLSAATEFYKNLIIKFRKSCGLPGELVLYKDGNSSISVEPTKLSKCHYLCHRFLICLGDLARYNELYRKQDTPRWSVAFTYYLKATRICPVSGNPHNQLALLATYVGDAFLALYHCIRSLAVKEPFPDAWNNLLLLFEENRSSNLHSLSRETHVDILKPSQIISLCSASHGGSVSSDNNNLDTTICDSAGKTELWPLLVRLTSFFLVGCRLEDFPRTLSSTVKHLEAVMALDDEQLTAALDSYQLMDSSRRGPYRSIQLVSVFIFIFDNQTTIQREKLNLINNEQQSAPRELAVVATFICIAHILGRCLKGKQRENCPLLPVVLVFMEWLIGAFDRVDIYSTDEKVTTAMSYFFDALADFLNRLGHCEDEIAADNGALWEDHELRGFEPIGHAHASLDFTTHQEWTDNASSMNLRRHRIFHAGMNLVNRSSDNRQWIFYDKGDKRFKSASSMGILGQEKAAGVSNSSLQVKEPQEQQSRTVKFQENDSPGESQFQHSRNGQSVAVEEEEVIVFKPIMRHNSAPLSKYIGMTDHISADGIKEQNIPADECLRRATSMFTGQNQAQNDGSSFRFDGTNARHDKPFKQQEPFLKDLVTYPAGPPSLSAWVFDTESSNFEPEKGIHDFHKRVLSPIPELAAESFTGLSISETKGPFIDSTHVSAATPNLPPTYVAPVPSAPLLPDDAIWFGGNSSLFQDYKSAVTTREPDGILGAPPVGGYSNVSATCGPLDFGPVLPGLVHGYPPLLGMSSSEWLYHYRNNHKLEQSNSPTWPVHLNGPGPLSSLHTNDISRFDLFSPWGNNLVSTPALYMESPQLHPGPSFIYGADVQRRDNLLGYQRPSLYVCGAGTETRPEQQPLLQYLKEKEWQLQREPQLRGTSAFMGN